MEGSGALKGSYEEMEGCGIVLLPMEQEGILAEWNVRTCLH